MTTPNDVARQTFVIHEALIDWLSDRYPEADPLAIVSALSYEIGRLVAQLSEGQSPSEVDAMLDGVRDVMRDHVAAFHRGLRR